MNFFKCDNGELSKYPLIEYVFSLVEDTDSIDEAINILLDRVGQIFDLNMIVIKEVIPGEHSVKCTYEWSSDNKKELLNVENRFKDEDWFKLIESFHSDSKGIKKYYNGDGRCPICIVRLDRVEALLELPVYRKEEFIGCIDFIDSINRRQWEEDEIILLKQMCRILSSYLFHMREYDVDTEEARQMIEYDSITKLPNYELFLKEARNAIKNIDDTLLIVTSSDISNFKYINEKYGYLVGNKILKKFAEHIYDSSFRLICSCRAYSDNFMTISKCDKNVDTQKILYVLEKIGRDYVSKLRDEYFDSNLIVNAGMYIISNVNEDIENAVSNANLARKIAKEQKANNGCRCNIFRKSMLEELKRQAEYVSSMESAISNNDFIVYIQPKVMSDTLEIIGAEALVRWKKSNGELIYPGSFIPALEKDGCIIKLDYYVYEQVFKFQKERLENKKQVIPISVNVSIVHMYDKKLVHFFADMLKKYNIPAEYIEIELSEQIYLSDIPNVSETLDGLKRLGFLLFIDDFGTGFSSLNTLTKYNISGIKLDRTFMKDTLEKNDKIIISCIVDMANKLNLQVLCEGVETEEQRKFIIKIGCPYMQGFYFSKPVSMNKFKRILDNQ